MGIIFYRPLEALMGSFAMMNLANASLDNIAEINNLPTENEKQGAEYFQEKHKYYPIPSGELNNNDAMVQTELWR